MRNLVNYVLVILVAGFVVSWYLSTQMGFTDAFIYLPKIAFFIILMSFNLFSNAP